MKVAILAHEQFPDRAKTAVGILRYADHDVVAVLDRTNDGRYVSEFLPGVQDAPIHASMETVSECDALIIGIAPIGGGFEDAWRADVRTAIERGCDVWSGLHYFLEDDAEFAALADEHGVDLWDVRKPHPGLSVADGVADEVDAEVVLTVGTDCSVGKMTTSMELVEGARERGIDAAFVPTGQTGIMAAGWGNPVDRVVSDFTAGSVEEMVLEVGNDHDLLVVEGQGSIVHPAYSAVTCGILHGAMADQLVLCHAAGREAIHGYEDFALPPLADYVALYEDLSAPVHDAEVAAGALATHGLDGDAAARAAIESFEAAIEAPASDPIRFGVDPILEALV